MKRKIFLIGLPGAGKTTMGLDLAVDLGIQFVDLDQDIEKASKQTISEIFKEKGEGHFRQLEKLHLERVLDELDEFVMATGGGTPCFFNNLETMKRAGTCIFINTPVDQIQKRLEKDTTRPLMKSTTLEELLAKRKEWYSQADHTIQEYKELIKLF
ncbi:shikimate kinase [Ekhidna sp.]|uniref:shikimate kinase n=1 Tax=Ekhidna sp. TaxID=2608089 RepID=UPI0032EDE81C